MSNTLRTVRLYGKLGAAFGRRFDLAVKSPAEAIRALCALLPQFDAYLMQAKDKGMAFSIFVGTSNLDESQLHVDYGTGDIRIAPIMMGAKKGWTKVIGGALLWVAGAYLELNGYVAVGEALRSVGRALMVGGVTQLLTPTPRSPDGKDRPEDQSSYLFNGSVNTQAQGNPVPLLYGRMVVGSAVISASIVAEDVYIPTSSSGPGVGSGGGGGSTPRYVAE